MPTETEAEVEAAAEALLGAGHAGGDRHARRARRAAGDGGRASSASRRRAVTPVDTTGAGDAFVGAFARYHAAGASLEDALARAARYAADSVRRNGTQKAYATEAEFEAFERSLAGRG